MTKTAEDLYLQDQQFRDHISTVDEKGKRIWIYPKKPKGKYHNKRIIVSIILLTLLFAGPFIRVDGHPFMLFNFFERKFILFGAAFWPQDFHLFLLAMIAFFVFIILFTMVYGRVWCGWACPQTIFMEMVFRKIEYWIEGDAIQQRKLDKQPWSLARLWKKGLKHIIFILISVLIAHTLMAYLIGIDGVVEVVSESPVKRLAGFTGLLLFTAIFYFVFAWFREQACVAVCPYGRFQGVLLGKSSINVTYDWKRGEPRGKLKKTAPKDVNGDCIDCKWCVHVCPTGIDIRNGIQLECINCTACMDACDQIMRKISKPEGLIRYASNESIEEDKNKLFNARVGGYTVALVLILSALVYLLATRTDVETTALRVPGMLYQEQPDNRISNLFNIKFVNKTFQDVALDLKVENGTIKRVGGENVKVPANAAEEGVFFIEMPRENLDGYKTRISIQVLKDGKLMDEVKANFMGPLN